VPCLFVLFAAFAPRLLLVFLWLARPALMGQAFETFLIPLLGFIFLPFTTLIWVLLWASSGGNVTGTDWIWIGLAVLLDLGHWFGGAANRRGTPAGVAASPSMAAAPVMSSTAGVPLSGPMTPPSPEAPPSPVPTPQTPPLPTSENTPPADGPPPSA
jgi:hypothetical protein